MQSIITNHAITAPFSEEQVENLHSGDRVLLSGVIYTARDAAHARLAAAVEKSQPLPFGIQGNVLYYVGPSPAQPGAVIGSAGPTTSSRMDSFTPKLLKLGLKGMIGKGPRSPEVKHALRQYTAVYLGATGGAAALLAHHITACDVIAYPELGPEAIYRLELRKMPLIVINDCFGNDLYEEGRKKYRR